MKKESVATKAAGVIARSALFDKTLTEKEADTLILGYNSMPYASSVCTRKEYRDGDNYDAIPFIPEREI